MEGEERKVNWTFSGSYTVEMAYIMAVFCMVMVVLVQQAYRIHDETKERDEASGSRRADAP